LAAIVLDFFGDANGEFEIGPLGVFDPVAYSNGVACRWFADGATLRANKGHVLLQCLASWIALA